MSSWLRSAGSRASWSAPGHEPIRGVTVRRRRSSAVMPVPGIAGRRPWLAMLRDGSRFPPSPRACRRSICNSTPKKSLPLRGEAPKYLIAKAGHAIEVTIPLRETVTVRGLVREKESNRPVPGVKVVLNGRLGGDHFAVTDATGTFTGRIVREMTQSFGWPVRIPRPSSGRPT